jgi:hypothetical protein
MTKSCHHVKSGLTSQSHFPYNSPLRQEEAGRRFAGLFIPLF